MRQLTFIAPYPAHVAAHLSYLRRAGYSVRLAGDVDEAVAMAAAQRPDLVFLDLGDSTQAGLDMLRSLKGDGRLGAIPLVMMAWWEDLDDVMLGLDLGASDYVIKAETTPWALARCVPTWTGGSWPALAPVAFEDVPELAPMQASLPSLHR